MIGGRFFYADDMDTYSSVVKAILARLLMVIAKANKYQLLMGDIKIAYL